MGKQPLLHRGLSYWPSKFILATLVKGHHIFMPIYSQICLLASEEKNFKDVIYIIIGKTAQPPVEPHLLMEQVCLNIFGRGSLDDHVCQFSVKSVHWFLRRF